MILYEDNILKEEDEKYNVVIDKEIYATIDKEDLKKRYTFDKQIIINSISIYSFILDGKVYVVEVVDDETGHYVLTKKFKYYYEAMFFIDELRKQYV